MENQKTFWNNAFFVFILPAMALAYAYCFESGYASFYDIPSSLVTINNNSILFMILPAAILFYFLYSLDNILSTIKTIFLRDVQENFIKIRLSKTFFMLLYFGFIGTISIVIYSNNRTVVIMYSIIISFYLLRFILQTIELFRKKKGIIPWDMDKEYKTDNTVIHMENLLGKNAVILLTLAFFTGILIYGTGNYVARKQQVFYILNDNTDNIALRQIGQKYILVPKNELNNGKPIHFSIIDEKSVNKIQKIEKKYIQ